MNIKQLNCNVTIPIFIIFALLIGATPSWAKDYYVDAINGNDGNPGTLSQPWKTIGEANSTLKAGDTVFIRGGTYAGQQIHPTNNGTANNRIVYHNYNDETVIIEQTDTAVDLSNRSYVTIHGITVQNCDKYLTMTNGHYNHIEYSRFDAMRNYERFEGFRVGPDASYNWIHHNKISRYGEYTGGNDRGDMVYIGDDPNPGNTHHNLVEYNDIHYGGHNAFSVNGHHNVVRNNYFHNEEWKNGYGGRISTVKAGKMGGLWNLFEGNRWCFTGIPPDNNFSPGLKFHSNDNIVRKNMFYASKGPGIQLATLAPSVAPLVDSNHIFHNVFFYNGIGGVKNTMAIRFTGGGGPIKGTVIKNNIFYQNVGKEVAFSGGSNAADNTVVSNWATGNPLFADANTALLDEFNQDYPDFKLQLNSPCIDTGAFLTTTTNSGSGTRLPVENAHYFMDGYGIIEGDLIQLENQTQTAQVIAVDYDNNILTIDTSLSWSNNQGVSLQYSGSAPDLGAFESGSDDTLAPPTNLRIVQQ